jgi:hypothetical protein
LVKPDTVKLALYSCVKIDTCLTRQSKSLESDIVMLGATTSTVDDYLAEKKKG